MESHAFARELEIATLAVHKASLLTRRVTQSHSLNELSKSDHSPVTIADFGAQAVLISQINAAFPEDTFIGEEDSSVLRGEAGKALRERVWDVVRDVDAGVASEDDMLSAVDLGGNGQGGLGRVWMLDPVDGTAAFVKGEQYAVALCLVIDGVQKVGVLGCPNLNLSEGTVREKLVDSGDGNLGWLIYAIEGRGAWRRKMSESGLGEPIRMDITARGNESRQLRFVESTTKNRDIPRQRAVADAMGASWPGSEIWSMQMKYMAVATGGDDLLVRISPRGYRGYVWDHAGGQLIFSEAGGVVCDAEGKVFDFGRGRKLDDNWGVVAAAKALHPKVMEEVRKAIATPDGHL